MPKLMGPLSAVQTLAITHPATAKRDRDAVMRNEHKTLTQVKGMSEAWANKYLNYHPRGQEVSGMPQN